MKKLDLTIRAIDNGYILTYPSGKEKELSTFFGMQKYIITGTRYCFDEGELAATVAAMIHTWIEAPAVREEVAAGDDDDE